MGKLETGRLAKGKKLSVMPNGSKVKVASIEFEEAPIKVGVAGMNLKVCFSFVWDDYYFGNFRRPISLLSSCMTFI